MRGHVARETPDDEMPPLRPAPPYHIRQTTPYIAHKADEPAITPRLRRLLWLLSTGVVLGSMIGFLLAFLV